MILSEESRDHDVDGDAVFMNAFIPHKLDHILHFERDAHLVLSGKEVNNPFQTIVSKVDISGDKFGQARAVISSTESSECDTDEEADIQAAKSTVDKKDTNCRDRDESLETKKQRKRLVREEKREKRLIKVPKHVKKRRAALKKH